jgi:hypothetical protein
MVALKILDVAPTNAASGPVVLERSKVELWADDLSTSSSSPILAGDTAYIVTEKGDLCAVDANTGAILGKRKLGIEQRNAALLFADGKLYVPMLDDPAAKTDGSSEAGTTGAFYIVKPGKDLDILAHIALDGRCFGTPTAYNGKVYIQTTRHVYCFGKKGNNPGLAAEPAPEKWPAPGPAKSLQIIPSEVVLRPGQSAAFHGRSIDANGFTVEEIKDVKALKWASYIPPTARVKSTMKAAFDADGRLVLSRPHWAISRAISAAARSLTCRSSRTSSPPIFPRPTLKVLSSPIHPCRGSAPASNSTCATKTAARC